MNRRRIFTGVAAVAAATTAVAATPEAAAALPAGLLRLGQVNAHRHGTGTVLTGASHTLLAVDNSAGTGIAVRGAATSIAATSGDGCAAHGHADSGFAVDAHTNTGTAVRALASGRHGQALQAVGPASFAGRTSFRDAGAVTVPAGSSHVQLAYHGNEPTSYALATCRAYVQGIGVAAAVIDLIADTLTVHLTGVTPVDMPVAYLILN